MTIFGDPGSRHRVKVKAAADVALLAYTRLAGEGGFDLATRPHVVAWIARCERALGLAAVATAH